MVLSHTVEFVGVGLPNPSGLETKPLRWMPCLDLFFPAPLRLYVRLSLHSCRLPSIRGGIPFFTPHASHAAPLGLNTAASPSPFPPLSLAGIIVTYVKILLTNVIY